jgi:hypothetical protein
MARYTAALRLDDPREAILVAQPGQWINYNGARGRYMGYRRGIYWIAWGTTATRRFQRFAAIYREQKA